MRRLTLPLMLALSACASDGRQTDGPSLAAMHAAAARLPTQVGAWVRDARPPTGDAVTGLGVRYNIAGIGAWATVFIGALGPDGPYRGPIPDGLDSPQIAAWRRIRMAGENSFEATNSNPGAPPQACQFGLPSESAGGAVQAVCVTGAGGHYVRTRYTYPVPANWMDGNRPIMGTLTASTLALSQATAAAVARR